LLLALAAFSSAATAGPFPAVVQFETLRVGDLVNVDDAAGRWQHEGGEVFFKGEHIGNYATYRRVTFAGTSPQNTAMVTMTIFFFAGNTSAPQNITLQGSHDFNTGEYVGSISGASKDYRNLRDNFFVGQAGVNGTLEIHP